MLGTLHLELPGDVSAVETARLAVLRHLAPLALGARTVYAIELILEETLMNIVSYAWPEDAGAHRIGLRVDADEEQVLLRLEDDGVEFDPLQRPPVDLPTTLDEAEPGGLGLMLARKHARRLDYQRRGGRNLLSVSVARA